MKNERLKSLQVFRGIAAFLVVLYHASVYSSEHLGHTFAGGIFLFGHTGVDFFFVLSGFIIYAIHSRDFGHPERLVPYARKRLIRVFPIYWIVTAIKLTTLFLSPGIAKSHENDAGVIIRSLLLLPQRNLPIIGAAWTLTYELIFYILFGCAILLNRRWFPRLATVWILGMITYATADLFHVQRSDSLLLQFLFNERNLEFCMGCLAAHVIARRKVPGPLYVAATGVLLFAAAAGSIAQGWIPVLYSPIFGVASFLIVLGTVTHELANGLRVPRMLVFLGDASYSIYLTHVMFINLAALAVRRLGLSALLGPQIATVVNIAFAVLAATAFYAVIERPLLRWLSRRSTRVQPGILS